MKSARLGDLTRLFSLTAYASTTFLHDREGFCTLCGTKSFAIMSDLHFPGACVIEGESDINGVASGCVSSLSLGDPVELGLQRQMGYPARWE
jgi:hypothetical protein